MEEALPGIDSALVEEFATDFLLEAFICIDFDDLNYVLIRPGQFLSGVSQASPAADFKNSANKLLNNLLEKRVACGAPSGVLVMVRSSTGLIFSQFVEYAKYIKKLLPEATECFFGFFYDPDGANVKIRICLAGEVEIRDSPPIGGHFRPLRRYSRLRWIDSPQNGALPPDRPIRAMTVQADKQPPVSLLPPEPPIPHPRSRMPVIRPPHGRFS
ncbi:hypothetical protein DFR40_2011 [Azonexus fungiphilus]|uniref:Uncharacterized protein n=1 Tax=Azonexus fungiphilus TaxID=146940 RepID=A0A495WAB8_9RHOO|nr:hypothetical protein [Azonexus fungiphilus]RKT58070.1 hypothetical protein DFR40_2011 [Azonexus fungiphilus]